MSTAAKFKQEMLESPAYRLGTAIAIIEALLKGPDDMMEAWRRRAAEFLKDEYERAEQFKKDAHRC